MVTPFAVVAWFGGLSLGFAIGGLVLSPGGMHDKVPRAVAVAGVLAYATSVLAALLVFG